MAKAKYEIRWTKDLPAHALTYNYPRRWFAARHAVRELANGREEVLIIELPDKRSADLCKSAIYSESAKIRNGGQPEFNTAIYTNPTDNGSVELYVQRER